MTSVKESIHADTNVDVERAIREKDELNNLIKRNLFLKMYIFTILLINLVTFAFSQLGSMGDTFLVAGMLNIAISSISIYYHYIGQGIKKGFIEFRALGGMLGNLAVIENEASWRKDQEKPMFTVFNPTVTIYLFTVPIFVGVIFIIFGFFII